MASRGASQKSGGYGSMSNTGGPRQFNVTQSMDNSTQLLHDTIRMNDESATIGTTAAAAAAAAAAAVRRRRRQNTTMVRGCRR